MIFINDLLSRVQKSDRSDVLARVYFVSSLVFFVCPVFYIFSGRYQIKYYQRRRRIR